jgi:hypothetical protein
MAYCTRDPNWFDLYNAYERLKDGNHLHGASTERFRRTANALFRHPVGRFPPPSDPMTLHEATRFLRKLINVAADRAAKANGI